MRFASTLVVVLLANCLIAIVAVGSETTERPNFLFVLIDDMGYGDLSCYGGARVRTPSIDGLAREGLRFTQFYVNAPESGKIRELLIEEGDFAQEDDDLLVLGEADN